MGIFASRGFENLITVAHPLPIVDEKAIVLSLINELNLMFSLELSMVPSFNRTALTEDDVFDDDSHTKVILACASHLRCLAEHLDNDKWNIVNLTTPGWRVAESTVWDMVTEKEEVMIELDI
jgi:hypothetical protein